jgi:SAM-dependent methyltransferase
VPKVRAAVGGAGAFNIRIKPFLSHSGYLVRRANLRVFREFASRLTASGSRRPVVLDVGCGDKPFASLLDGVYHVGTDLFPSAAVDAVADNAMLPLRDNAVDGVIASETLEHTLNYEEAINEMIRVCKDGGLLFVSVPFMHPIHNPPYDFQRFTPYRLRHSFRDHELVSFVSSNSIFTAWLMTLGYGIKYASFFLPFSNALIMIPELLINLLTVAIEAAADGIWRLLNAVGLRAWLARRIDRKNLRGLWMAMPAGYAALIAIKKNRGRTAGRDSGRLGRADQAG